MSVTTEHLVARDDVRSPWRRLIDINARSLSAWVLSLSLILYLALAGGGYSLATHSQAGIVIWWVVVVSAAWGLLPTARPSRAALVTVGVFATFTAWTALGVTWSISAGRSFQDLALITCYLGIIVLAVGIHLERGEAIRHTTAAVATAVVIVAMLALASRLWPHLFPAAQQTGQFLTGAQARLSWPLNYWNALAALMALGVPLLLAQATSARTLTMQAVAAASIPLVALCAALTLSRGGVIEGAVAVFVFLALAPDRIPKVASAAVAATGSAVLVYGGFHRHAIQHGLTGSGTSHEATSLVIAALLTCLGVGVAQSGVCLLCRHATVPRVLRVSKSRVRLLVLGVLGLVVIALIVAGAPRHLSHAWHNFKSADSVSATSTSRFGSSSGEGRYQYWQAAVDSAEAHVLTGSGPGTYQLDWLPRAPFESYVENAHSLYFETYAELGIIGLGLLLAFLVAALSIIVRAVRRSEYAHRTRAAAIAAALVAFIVGAAVDWLWQVPVVPASILLLVGAALAPDRSHRVATFRPGLVIRVTTLVVGVTCLVALAYPLATNTDVVGSQSAAGVGNTALALGDAQDAVRLEPGAADAQIQLALVYETYRQYGKAVNAARRAVTDEATNWSNWLVLSRLQAENGNARGALTSYLKAKSLNPHSSLFNRDK
jgi:O-antigen ligase